MQLRVGWSRRQARWEEAAKEMATLKGELTIVKWVADYQWYNANPLKCKPSNYAGRLSTNEIRLILLNL